MKPFECPAEHRTGLEEVKRAVGIHHSYLDSWIFLFFENKKFDVQETIAKLNRRDIMERTVFSTYTMTPYLKQSMRSGIVQYVGRDFEGRPVLYFNTARDFPKTEERAERQCNMDMFVSWTVRCSRENPTSKVTWLINQKDSSMRKNTDIMFQKDMALRISKFFPGVVARMYICHMSTALTFVMKPLLRQLPSAISDCVFMYSGSDLSSGKLLEVIPASVLPIAMGGKNNCDNEQNYEYFATCVEEYFEKCIRALRTGITIKEMEMMEEYGVDREGVPVGVNSSKNSSMVNREGQTDNAIRGRSSGEEGSMEIPPSAAGGCGKASADTSNDAENAPNEAALRRIQLPVANLKEITSVPYFVLRRMNQVQRKNVDEIMQQLCYYAESMSTKLHQLMTELRDGNVDGDRLLELKEKTDLMQRTAHDLLCVFPPTSVKLNYPLFAWLIEPLLDEETSSRLSPEWMGMSSLIDCTSPDNFLLSLQSVAVEYIDECNTLEIENRTTMGMLSRIANVWSSNLSSREILSLLSERYISSWRKLVPYLQQYVECKVSMAIAEFIRYHGLLVSGGRINCASEWYTKLLGDMIQYREMRRKNYIFHIFPPLFSERRTESEAPPAVEELLQLRGLKVSFRNVMQVICLVERSMQNTLDQLASPVTVNIAARNVVEHYLENTMSKIYITYESQRSGVSPQELALQKQKEALRCLEAAQAPLTDFLFALGSTTWVKERQSQVRDRSWKAVASLLKKEKEEMSERVCIRNHSRLLANGLAAAAYNMQGSFSRSAFAQDVCTQEPPEGHAVALSLLFISAAGCQFSEGSSGTAPAESVNVSSFITSVTNLHKSAAAILNDVLF